MIHGYENVIKETNRQSDIRQEPDRQASVIQRSNRQSGNRQSGNRQENDRARRGRYGNRSNNAKPGEEKKTEKEEIAIILWNCNNLRLGKYTELLEYYYNNQKSRTICLLTETHHYGKILNLRDDMTGYGSFRSGKKVDRRGGGLQILMPKSEEFKFEKTKHKNTELLNIEGVMAGISVNIVLAYFDVRKTEEGRNRNKTLRKDIEQIIESNTKEGLIIAGDFNGHLRMIDGKEDDINGKMLLEWIGNYQLIMLNTEERCEGTFTRVNKDQKTTVDYILVNRKIYDLVEEIKIDENKEIIDGSDHVIMSVKLKTKIFNNGIKKAKWKIKEYYSQKMKIYKT